MALMQWLRLWCSDCKTANVYLLYHGYTILHKLYSQNPVRFHIFSPLCMFQVAEACGWTGSMAGTGAFWIQVSPEFKRSL
jgi:hypothetical protein